jgi:DNA-binding HxlR family transcriptional regulator
MQENCTIYKTTDFIGRQWTLLILLELYREKTRPKRYSEIKRQLPKITPKILSLRLKELEKEGLLNKKVDAKQFPIKCEYTLTKSGKDFINIIKDIKRWALKWKTENKICQRTDCQNCKLNLIKTN